VPDAPPQLLIAQVAFGADVFLNGERVAEVGRGSAGWWGRREPVWIPLPRSALRAGKNALYLRLHVRPEFAGYLTPLFVGPVGALQGLFRARNALVSAPDILALVSAVLTLLYLSVYRRTREAEWAWFAAGIGSLFLGGLPWRVVDLWIWPLAMGGSILCIAFGAHRIAGVARPGIERGLFGIFAALALALIVAPSAATFSLALATSAFDLGLAFYLLSLHNTPVVARWLGQGRGLRSALPLSMLMASNDLPMFWNHAPLLGIPLFPITHAPVVIASFAHIVVFLSDGLTRERALNLSLQESQSRLLALEHAQATRAERERVQRDLHDGLGAQLVAAIAVAEREPHDAAAVQRSLRGALGELRGAVDSLDGEPRELAEVLGALRARIEPLVQGTGTSLRWRVENLETPLLVAPQHGVHLLRVVQEAIANAVKHANARTLEVGCGEAERNGRRSAFVEVRDDGRGISGSARGRGLTNMRSRAAQLGGELAIESSGTGTRVVLWLPAPLTP
jgi:signal transduction histidine kinase